MLFKIFELEKKGNNSFWCCLISMIFGTLKAKIIRNHFIKLNLSNSQYSEEIVSRI